MLSKMGSCRQPSRSAGVAARAGGTACSLRFFPFYRRPVQLYICCTLSRCRLRAQLLSGGARRASAVCGVSTVDRAGNDVLRDVCEKRLS